MYSEKYISKLFDLTNLKEFVGDDNEKLIELIEIFLQSGIQIVDEIENAIQNNKPESLKINIHKLISQLEMLRINEKVLQKFYEFELHPNRDNLKLIKNSFQNIQSELQKFVLILATETKNK